MKDYLTPQLNQIIQYYGNGPQMLKCIEELNECAHALMKHYTGRKSNHLEEIADAIIMLEQMRLIYGARNIDELIEMKLGRTLERIEDASNRS